MKILSSILFLLTSVCAFGQYYYISPNALGGILNNPTITIGSGTNVTTFSATYPLPVATGTNTVWDDLRIADGQIRGGATAPSLATFGPSGTLRTYQFSATTLQEVEFAIQMPHDWAEGTALHPHVHWAPTTTDTNRVVWGFEYSWANIAATFGASTTLLITNYTGGTAWKHNIHEFSADIAGTGKTFSSILVCRLFRDATSGSDDYPDAAAFLEFDIHYERNSLGSRDEYVK